ncbi:MAG: Rho termination factor N-terminal domain-containing protein, partial [Pirellula sp.]
MTGNENDRPRSKTKPDEILSIAEEMLRERTAAPVLAPGESRPVLDFATLQRMSPSELGDIATVEKIPSWDSLERQELVFQILKSRMQSSGMMMGEGTLEVLTDGFGFLRSTNHH